VACLSGDDCTEQAAARCEAGACVPCQDSGDCASVPNLPVCEVGACVECAAGDEGACSGSETCDLLQKSCSGAPAASLSTCEACTNDSQCQSGARCVPMDYQGAPHGYYCLKLPAPTCERPYSVAINAPSLSGAPATDYCGIEESLSTCEAVLALVGGWYCTGTDGMCSPTEGGVEVPVEGALCRQVGLGLDRCTYGCSVANQCPATVTCGGTPAPTWCGG